MSAAVNRIPVSSISVESELAQVAEALRRATVHISGMRRGSGSGVIWRPDGLIITNAHVARESPMLVELWEGRHLTATLVARDPGCDLAALAVAARGLPAAEIGDPHTMRAGDIVIAVGNPDGAMGAVTRGILHAAFRGEMDWLESDLSLAPGNSGGPLADAHGRVIGINSMIVSGVAFSIPAERVRGFVRGALQHAR